MTFKKEQSMLLVSTSLKPRERRKSQRRVLRLRLKNLDKVYKRKAMRRLLISFATIAKYKAIRGEIIKLILRP